MKGIKRIAVVAGLCLAIFIGFTMVTMGSGPESVVRIFGGALNEMDADLMLDCFVPEISNPARAALSFSSALFGLKPEDVLSLIPFFDQMGMKNSENYANLRPKWTFSDFQKEKYQDGYIVTTKITVDQSGKRSNYTGRFYVVKIQGQWYIKDVR